MKLKYFIATEDINKTAQFYAQLFEAKIVKNTDHHAKLLLFGQIEILICHKAYVNSQDGILIIRFDKSEAHLYQSTLGKLKELNIWIEIANYKAKWGTTFTEFSDPFGYRWDLEIDTIALEELESKNGA